MAIEKTYFVYDLNGNPTQLPPGTYFCCECFKRVQIVPSFKKSEPAKPCPKYGHTVLFTI